MNKIEVVFDSVQKNQLSILKDYLNDDPSLAEVLNDNNVSLLLYAIYHRNSEAIALIKSYKNNIGVYEAVCLGDLPVVQTLLEKNLSLLNSFRPMVLHCWGLLVFLDRKKQLNI